LAYFFVFQNHTEYCENETVPYYFVTSQFQGKRRQLWITAGMEEFGSLSSRARNGHGKWGSRRAIITVGSITG
jgi:hypothetical protein